MQNDFSIGVEREVVIAIGQQSFFQNAVIGKLTIETKAEPLSFVDVLTFEWLGVIPIILPTGGISDVADRGSASKGLHQRLRLGTVIEAKDFGDRSDILAIFEQRWSVRIEGGHPSRQLASILDIEQHPRQQP